MDLPETADTLSILFRLLHEPPPVFQRVKPTPAKASTEDPLREAPDMSTVIPLPLIPIALNLADKYCLSLEAITALHSHIGAHVTTEPLKVYGMAISLGLDELASEASEYLLHPPLSAWRTDEIKVIPTVEALHQLVRLHAAREVELRRYLQGETVFPHGYEACRSHGTSTIAAWEERKQMLMPRIRAGEPSLDSLLILVVDGGVCRYRCRIGDGWNEDWRGKVRALHEEGQSRSGDACGAF
jgi:hypothetical protein